MSRNTYRPFSACGSIKNIDCEHQEIGGKEVVVDNGTHGTMVQPDTGTEMVPEKPAGTREVMLTTSNVLEDNPMWQMIARRCPDEW